MAITVQDCLKTSALHNAVVIAGHNGLNRPVNSITVLETTNTADILPAFIRENQIAITSLVAVKDDVDKQCALLRVLDEAKMSGIILFQFGAMFISRIDERLIKTANELSFPIICIAPEKYDILYTDVIHDIAGLIFRAELNNHFFLPDLFVSLKINGNDDANIDTVLPILAERFGGMLLLLDSEQNVLASTTMIEILTTAEGQPISHVFDLVECIKRHIDEQPLFLYYQKMVFSLYFGQQGVKLYNNPIVDKYNNRLCLWYLTTQQDNLNMVMEQITSIVVSFINSGSRNIMANHEDMLVAAILGRRYEMQQHLQKKLHVNLDKAATLWVHYPGPQTAKKPDAHINLAKQNHQAISMYAPLLQGNYQGKRIMFLPKLDPEEDLVGIQENIAAALEGDLPSGRHFVLNQMRELDDAAAFYQLVKRNFHAALVVYPHKRIFTYSEMFFVDCLEKTRCNADNRQLFWLDILKPLRQDEELLLLLEAMLLDTNMNVGESASLLFIHKNTVYYRMKKIRSLLGIDPFLLPCSHNMAMALALRRLINQV